MSQNSSKNYSLMPSITPKNTLFQQLFSRYAQLLVSFLVYIYIYIYIFSLLELLYRHCSGTCTALALPTLIVLRVLVHLLQQFFNTFRFFPFSQRQFFPFSFFSLFLFPEIGDFLQCCPIFGVVTHELWGYHRLNGFKVIGMVYYNCSSLMILVNHENYICFDPFFQPPRVFLHCRYKPFIKSIICQQHNN